MKSAISAAKEIQFWEGSSLPSASSSPGTLQRRSILLAPRRQEIQRTFFFAEATSTFFKSVGCAGIGAKGEVGVGDFVVTFHILWPLIYACSK